MMSVLSKIKNIKPIILKTSVCFSLFIFSAGISSQAETKGVLIETADEPPVSMAEMRYEKLMKIYLNKIKLAFSENNDARSLEILNQFLPEFSQKTEGLKKEFQVLAKGLNSREMEMLYSRISQRSHTGELVALLFDERVTSRMNTNPEIKYVMDALHAKSLEIQKSEREFIAADK